MHPALLQPLVHRSAGWYGEPLQRRGPQLPLVGQGLEFGMGRDGGYLAIDEKLVAEIHQTGAAIERQRAGIRDGLGQRRKIILRVEEGVVGQVGQPLPQEPCRDGIVELDLVQCGQRGLHQGFG